MKTIFYILIFSSVLCFSSCASKVVVHNPKPKKVAVVKVAPRGHRVVYVKGKRYYTWNGKHYRKTRRGYVVVRI